MKKKNLSIILGVALVALATVLISCTSSDGVMTKKKGVYTIDTTTLSQEVKGYNGPTPLLITIENDKVVKVEALENSETPRFFEHMTDGGMLERWNGMDIETALNTKVDAVAGATFSSNAVIENMRLGLTYYKEHK
ncbi:MAG: FMN-binding protein [Bacteroidales bacterium]|nr:FMN-binding protein [Bacteroidales bacterium]